MMKSPLTYIILFFLLSSLPGYGQYSGIATLSSVLLEEKEDSLFVDMEIVVHSHSLNPYQSLTLIPELTSDGDGLSQLFPDVLINGKKKAKMYERYLNFNKKKDIATPLVRLDINRKTDTVLVYRFSTPYEFWMDTASLKVHQILSGCADSEKKHILEHKARVKTENLDPYQPVVKVNYFEPVLEAKHRNVEETAYLDFQIGQAVIQPNFKRNPSELDKIRQSIIRVQNDEDVTITGMRLTGYASPDGSYKTNERLSGLRAAALQAYISNHFGIPARMIDVNSIAEDWKGFRDLMEGYSFPDKDRIMEIIDSPEDLDRKEQQLRALSASYKIILNDLFPQLRRVVYEINYTVRDYSVEETEVLLLKNPEHLSPYEIYKVAERYPVDSGEWHELMEKTVRLYPEDQTARMNAAASLLQRGRHEEAAIHIDAITLEPRFYNNLGAYYLLAGDPDKAEFYLKQAGIQDFDGTIHNLQETRMLREDIEKRNRRKR